MSSKAYLFCTPSISALGGAERYMAGKIAWLKTEGWDVYIAGPCPNTPAVDYGDTQILDIRHFNVRPFTLLENNRRSVVSEIVETLRGYERVFIESTTICYGFWGEYLASTLSAEHVIFHLSEEVPRLSRKETEWLIAKHRRREVYFIKEGIARLAIGPTTGSESVLRAYMPPAVDDCVCDESLLNKTGYRLGCVSRLDKPFLVHAFEEIAKFAQKHQEFNLEVVVIGDATNPEKSLDYIRRLSEIAKGTFSLIAPGGMSPVPRRLVKTFDFGFGKAGGALCVAGEGIPTLSYAMDTDEPIGVLGFDFNKTICAFEGESVDFVTVLEHAILENAYVERPMPFPVLREEPEYIKHFHAFASYNGIRTPIVPIVHASAKESIKGLAFMALGPRGYTLIKQRLRDGC